MMLRDGAAGSRRRSAPPVGPVRVSGQHSVHRYDRRVHRARSPAGPLTQLAGAGPDLGSTGGGVGDVLAGPLTAPRWAGRRWVRASLSGSSLVGEMLVDRGRGERRTGQVSGRGDGPPGVGVAGQPLAAHAGADLDDIADRRDRWPSSRYAQAARKAVSPPGGVPLGLQQVEVAVEGAESPLGDRDRIVVDRCVEPVVGDCGERLSLLVYLRARSRLGRGVGVGTVISRSQRRSNLSVGVS
jgi:hypothetical protein